MLFFFQTMFDFFYHIVSSPNAALLRTHLLRRMVQDLTFIFSKIIFDFFYHTTSSWTLRFFVRTCFEEWFRISLLFFQNGFWFFFFLFLLYFYFFHKNYYHFTKGKEPAQSPKPAVSFPLNPFLLGHGSGLRPKNLPPSEVSSVSCEQIRENH